MITRTSELSGAALDWAVTKCERPEIDLDYFLAMHNHYNYPDEAFDYSTNWGSGGRIIEREEIDIYCHESPRAGNAQWIAEITGTSHKGRGETPLVAAMRCYVASKLGDEVQLPEEVYEQQSDS